MDLLKLKDEIISVENTKGRNDKGVEYPIIITKKISRIFINFSKDSIKITFRRTYVYENLDTGNTQNQHSKGEVIFDITHLDIKVLSELRTKIEDSNYILVIFGILDLFSQENKYGGKRNFNKDRSYIERLLSF